MPERDEHCHLGLKLVDGVECFLNLVQVREREDPTSAELRGGSGGQQSGGFGRVRSLMGQVRSRSCLGELAELKVGFLFDLPVDVSPLLANGIGEQQRLCFQLSRDPSISGEVVCHAVCSGVHVGGGENHLVALRPVEHF